MDTTHDGAGPREIHRFCGFPTSKVTRPDPTHAVGPRLVQARPPHMCMCVQCATVHCTHLVAGVNDKVKSFVNDPSDLSYVLVNSYRERLETPDQLLDVVFYVRQVLFDFTQRNCVVLEFTFCNVLHKV